MLPGAARLRQRAGMIRPANDGIEVYLCVANSNVIPQTDVRHHVIDLILVKAIAMKPHESCRGAGAAWSTNAGA